MSGVVDSHPGMLFDALAQFDALSRQCEMHMSTTTPELLSHVSTASHARDMLEISEKMGFNKVRYWGVSCEYNQSNECFSIHPQTDHG